MKSPRTITFFFEGWSLDPAHIIGLQENGRNLSTHWWRVRLILWLIDKLIPRLEKQNGNERQDAGVDG
jgi:hypothetical protein